MVRYILRVRLFGAEKLLAVSHIVFHQEDLACGWQELQVESFDVEEPAIVARMRGSLQHQFKEALTAGRCNRKHTRGAIRRERGHARISRGNQASLRKLAEQGRECTSADLILRANNFIRDFGDAVGMQRPV